MEDEYELLSHEEIDRLKKEAERYKNNPFIKNGADDKLYNSIMDMTKSINRLSAVFEDVKKQILNEQESGDGPDAKMDKILEQNKHMAQALLAFGEKLEELSKKHEDEQSNYFETDDANQDEEQDNNSIYSQDAAQTTTAFQQPLTPPITPQQQMQSSFEPQSLRQAPQQSQQFNQQSTQFQPQQNFQSQQSNQQNTLNQQNNQFQSPFPRQQTAMQQNNQSQQNQVQQPTTNQNDTFDLDYQMWNYNKPTKPGVSQSSPSLNFEKNNNFDNNMNISNGDVNNGAANFDNAKFNGDTNTNFDEGFPRESQPGFTSFLSPNQSDVQNNNFNFNSDNKFQQGFTNSNAQNNLSELKPLNENTTRKKKRSFGLF